MSPQRLERRDDAVDLEALPGLVPVLDALGDATGVCLVGGAVRDVLLGTDVPPDLDLVVEGDTEPVARRLAGGLGGEARVHGRFGTASVRWPSGRVDLARARRERYAQPGALPDVEPADLADDLWRRDFTVNAIAAPLAPGERGRLRAVTGAFDDLEARRLRVLHDASFRDDPTRLLRMVRYAARLQFAIEERTLALAHAAVSDGAPATVSGERLGAELRLLLEEPDPAGALAVLRDLELDRALGLALGNDPELAARALALVPADAHRGRTVLAAAAAPGDPGPALDRLGFPAPERDTIALAARRADAAADALAAASRPSEIAAAARGLPVEAVAVAGALGPATAARDWIDRLRHVRLDITGDDLLAAGAQPGPALGRALETALEQRLDGAADGRDQQLAVALAALREDRR